MRTKRYRRGLPPILRARVLPALVLSTLVVQACHSTPTVRQDSEIVAASKDNLTSQGPGQVVCDDGNPCTDDYWDGTSCGRTMTAAGTSCDDANVCNGYERCDGVGACISHNPPVLDDGNPCTTDSCSPQTGVTHQPNTGQSCVDDCGIATVCTAAGACGAGPLDDGNPCTADSCDTVTGAVHTNRPAGFSCDDGNVCNGISFCDAFGLCTQLEPTAEGASCSDGNVCNGAETCIQGRCTQGNPPPVGSPCDDANQCTELDSCDGLDSCIGSAAPTGTSCDDGNPCTGADVCNAGSCTGSVLNGTLCGDGDACNGLETCQAGQCQQGSPVIVDDEDPSTLDACNPLTGQVSHAPCGNLDLTVVTTVADMAECLYSGPSPLQTGMTANINPLLAGIIHGTVRNAAGDPLAGVVVTMSGRTTATQGGSSTPMLVESGYGQTITRADGVFDLAVNGGSNFVLEYQREGYLPSQREVTSEPGRFVNAPDVVLREPSAKTTPVELGMGNPDIQVARGDVVVDSRGSRQVTLFFQPGTSANLVMPDGTQSPMSAGEIHVRATEYTTGPEGPEAMPASLPSSSAYTYAVELTADEAEAAGAARVVFTPSVIAYLENFIGVPVGESVPSGAYRPDAGLWEVQKNGMVLQIVAVTNGLADLNIDTDPGAETSAELLAKGITDDERERLAELYSTGQTLWRVPVEHFSTWDWNYGFGPVAAAVFPQTRPWAGNPKADACKQSGSIIGCESRSLGEVFGVVGTPFSLHYQSDRTPGYKTPIHVPATDATISPLMKAVKVEFDVAGQHHAVTLPPEPNLTVDFSWDGKNAFGVPTQGPQAAVVSVGYEFPRSYGNGGEFGASGGNGCQGCIVPNNSGYGGGALVSSNFITMSKQTPNLTLWQRQRFALHQFNAVYLGLGGLTLNVHHTYDPSAAVLYLGNGERVLGESLVTVSTHAGGGTSTINGAPAKSASLPTVRDVARGPDGSLYVATTSSSAHRIARIDTENKVYNVWAGTPGVSINSVEVGSDGSVYFSSGTMNRIYKMAPGATSPQPMAGNGSYGFAGVDGTSALSASFAGPTGIALGLDGSLYVADTENYRVRRIDPEGKIWNITNGGFCHPSKTSADCGDGGPASSAKLNYPIDVAVGPDGAVYFAEYNTHRVRTIGADGIVRRVAGLSEGANVQQVGPIVSGVPAKTSKLVYPTGLSMGADGSLYISEAQRGLVRKVNPPLVSSPDETVDNNGKIYTVAGTGTPGPYSGEGGIATAATLHAPSGIYAATDGTLYIADSSAGRVLKVQPSMPGLSLAKTSIGSSDGGQIYIFDENRRHEKTIDSMTGKTLYSFDYDLLGRLSKITNSQGKETTISRVGSVVTLTGSNGHVTTLTLNNGGYAQTIEGPDGEAVQLTYTSLSSGLLASLIDPRGNQTTFTYDSEGRLLADVGPVGNSKSLVTNTQDEAHSSVSLVTGQGRTTTYETDDSSPSISVRKIIDTTGMEAVTESAKPTATPGATLPPGTSKTTFADGTTIVATQAPDPRLGYQAPFVKLVTTSSGGITHSIARTRTVAYAANNISNVTSMVDQTTINSSETWTSNYQKLSNGSAMWSNVSPLGRQTTTSVDADGRPVQFVAPGLAPITISYVASGPNAGKPWKVEQTDGTETRSTEFAYDAQGNLTQVISPLQQTSHYTHDVNGRVTQATLPGGVVLQVERDENGNVTGVFPQGPGGAHQFAYDSRNFVSQSELSDLGPGSEKTHYSYSQDGEPVLVTQADGSTIALSYDAAGRLIGVATPTGAASFTYDPSITGSSAGKLTSVTNPFGLTESFGYNGALLTDASWSGPVSGTFHFAYDNQFRVQSETVNGHTVARAYNADGQLIGTGSLTIDYNPTTGFLSGTNLGVVHDAVSWNAFGEAVSYDAFTTASLLTRTFDRDVLGRLTEVTESGVAVTPVTRSYAYDAAGRLTDVWQDGALAAHYGYDAHGNRTVTEYPGQTPITATFDNQDRLIAFGSNTYIHAITGERLTQTTPAGTTAYGYDTSGQLTNVTLPDGTFVQYAYDSEGRRITKTVNGVATQRFLYAGELGPAALVDASGTLLERYVYATSSSVPDFVVRLSGPTAGTYRLIKDEIGSVRLVVNTSTGVVHQTITYDAYGRILQDTNPGFTPFGYAGGLLDLHTGLVRFGARDYDPETGRWTTQDPIGLTGGDTNLYAYVAGDPINASDPSGLSMDTGNPAMDSALNSGGLLNILGFGTYAAGAYNYNEGMLKLSNESSFNEGLRQISQGICQMVRGGIEAAQNGQVAMALPALGSFATRTGASLLKSANQLFKNGPLTAAGRALTKHPNIIGESGNLLQKLGGAANVNSAASAAVENILNNGTMVTKMTKAFGEVIEYTLGSGLGARWSATTGDFIGFLGRGL